VDIDNYPKDWKNIAFQVKVEADWKCERCNHPDDPNTGHMLTVHHLNGIKKDCRRKNLVALCQKCHLHVQSVRNPYEPYCGQLFLKEINDTI